MLPLPFAVRKTLVATILLLKDIAPLLAVLVKVKEPADAGELREILLSDATATVLVFAPRVNANGPAPVLVTNTLVPAPEDPKDIVADDVSSGIATDVPMVPTASRASVPEFKEVELACVILPAEVMVMLVAALTEVFKSTDPAVVRFKLDPTELPLYVSSPVPMLLICTVAEPPVLAVRVDALTTSDPLPTFPLPELKVTELALIVPGPETAPDPFAESVTEEPLMAPRAEILPLLAVVLI